MDQLSVSADICLKKSDIFATPTGSVTSLNIQDDDPPKSKQSVHSNAFVETPV